MPVPHPILGERIARHGFTTRPAADPAAAAALVCGIQAQDGPASRLGVRARCSASAEQDVLDAIGERRVVRTWLMRNTIHLVSASGVEDWPEPSKDAVAAMLVARIVREMA